MNEIKYFEFEGNEITFQTGENTLINATQMAKQFDVQPAFWLRTDQAKRLIEALTAMHNCIPTDLVIVKNGGDNFGTWMHEDVALAFAQWLSPEFYIWCNDRIKELFRYGITATQETTRAIVFSLSDATTKLKNSSTCTVGKHKVYELLRIKGILNQNNKPTQEYIDKGWFELEPYGFNKYIKYPTVTELGLKELRDLLFPETTFDNSALAQLLNEMKELKQENKIIKQGLHVVVESLLMAKSGSKSEEQNRELLSHLKEYFELTKPTMAIAAS
jgi:hypothetical protein